MKAVVLHEYGGPDKLKYEDFPDPVLAPGQVLIRVTSTSVNPVDYKMRSGAAKSRFPVQFPGILGRDVAGIVRAIAPDVQGFAPGDHVFALAHATYAELCAVPANELAKVPEGLDLVESAALPLVCLTGEQLVREAAAVQPGQTILIAGAVGSVGRVAVHTAKKMGAKVIAGVRKSQVQEAQTLHADLVLALDDEAQMKNLGLLDCVADAVGGKTAEALLGKVKQGGIFASVLGPPANALQHPTVQVHGMMAHPDPAKLIELGEDVVKKTLVIPIDRMVPLAEASEAQAAAEKGGVAKILLLA